MFLTLLIFPVSSFGLRAGPHGGPPTSRFHVRKGDSPALRENPGAVLHALDHGAGKPDGHAHRAGLCAGGQPGAPVRRTQPRVHGQKHGPREGGGPVPSHPRALLGSGDGHCAVGRRSRSHRRTDHNWRLRRVRNLRRVPHLAAHRPGLGGQSVSEGLGQYGPPQQDLRDRTGRAAPREPRTAGRASRRRRVPQRLVSVSRHGAVGPRGHLFLGRSRPDRGGRRPHRLGQIHACDVDPQDLRRHERVRAGRRGRCARFGFG